MPLTFRGVDNNRSARLFRLAKLSKVGGATLIDRRDERTHLFIVATVYIGHQSFPVRVRNISPTGALIEGTNLPPVGTEINLRRGQLQASGTVAWTASGKSGLSFNSPVAVSSWLPSKEASRQLPIDRLAFELKHAGPTPKETRDIAIKASELSSPSIVADLESLQVKLSELADKLSLDMILVATHPEVQFLDEAIQRIGKIIQSIQTSESFVHPITA